MLFYFMSFLTYGFFVLGFTFGDGHRNDTEEKERTWLKVKPWVVFYFVVMATMSVIQMFNN